MNIFSKLLFLTLIPGILCSTEEKLPDLHNDFEINLSGYVKLDAFFDSRQNVDFREGFDLLYPKPRLIDPCTGCSDINDHKQFTMVPFETRLAVDFKGPKINDIKVFGRIEADFVGAFDEASAGIANVNVSSATTFRLRKAYLELDWVNMTLLFGQFFHPLLFTDCYPDVISYNNGNPIEIYSRNPQVRFSYFQDKNFEVILTALAEAIEFCSNGPIGDTPTYFREAAVPNFNFAFKKYLSEKNILNFSFDYKRLTPRIVSDKGCKVHENINSVITAIGYTHQSTKNRICAKTYYAQNGTMFGTLGGYAVSAQNPVTQERKYTNLNAWGIWLDVESIHGAFTPGFFIGYVKNLGSSQPLYNDPKLGFITYTNELAQNIDNVFRVCPRLFWDRNGVRFAGELECTSAAYGTLTKSGKVINTDPVTNVRFLFAAYYFF